MIETRRSGVMGPPGPGTGAWAGLRGSNPQPAEPQSDELERGSCRTRPDLGPVPGQDPIGDALRLKDSVRVDLAVRLGLARPSCDSAIGDLRPVLSSRPRGRCRNPGSSGNPRANSTSSRPRPAPAVGDRGHLSRTGSQAVSGRARLRASSEQGGVSGRCTAPSGSRRCSRCTAWGSRPSGRTTGRMM